MAKDLPTSQRLGAPRVHGLMALALMAFTTVGHAGQVKLPFFGEKPLDLVYNTTFIGGVAVRSEPQHAGTIAKNNLNPEVCGRTGDTSLFQACQGLFTGQTFPAERLVNAPGSFSTNFDQGNLNYEQWDLAQGLLRINQDVTFGWNDWFLFAKAIAIYDPVNYRFKQTHPNLITDENFQ